MKTTKITKKVSNKFKQLKGSLLTLIATFMLNAMSMTTSATTAPATSGASGSGGSGTGDMWQEIVDFIGTWIPRLGGAIIVIGLIMFGLGWQRDDADGKTRGIQVCIGGAIVAAVGGLTGTFMA
jgi:hypothetical protein